MDTTSSLPETLYRRGRGNRASRHFRTILAALRGLERCGVALAQQVSCPNSNVGKGLHNPALSITAYLGQRVCIRALSLALLELLTGWRQ